MTIRSIAAIVATTGGFLCLSTQPAVAQNTLRNNALRILVSNGMKGTIEELQPLCEKAIGRSLAIQFGSTASLKKRIEMGEAFDVTIITTEAIGDLIKQGKLTGASRTDVGRSELGIGIRSGGPTPRPPHARCAHKKRFKNQHPPLRRSAREVGTSRKSSWAWASPPS